MDSPAATPGVYMFKEGLWPDTSLTMLIPRGLRSWSVVEPQMLHCVQCDRDTATQKSQSLKSLFPKLIVAKGIIV